MKSKKHTSRVVGLLAVILIFTSIAFAASSEKVVVSFFPGPGTGPTGSVLIDAAGNLYGTAYGQGSCPQSCGVVWELAHNPPPGFHNVLHIFRNTGDGTNPYRDRLIFDAAGNLYGTASFGGAQKHGAVYEMTPLPDGTWSEALLYSFAGQQAGDGERPMGNLVFDTAGNLYGITANGGSLGCGIVYQLTPSGGSWTESVIHTFTCVDGRYPQAGLVIDAAGNLYGTAMQGASPACGTGCGTVFKLAPSGGSFTFSVIYSFQGGNDGANPQGSLAFDNAGSLYGTTTYGGSTTACGGAGCGTVFKLTPSGGSWTESVLYSFTGVPDGASPFSQVTFDAAGNIYGTTYQGGAVKVGCADQTAGCGTVFKLTASGGGWTESVVHRFLANSSSDGANPLAGVTMDARGNLFGTTLYGGTNSGVGTLYKIQP